MALAEAGRPFTGTRMTESGYAVTAPGHEAMPRCCPQHDDWPTLSEHLLVDFPRLPVGDIVGEVRAAKRAVATVGLPDGEALEVGELIARHQLMIIAGSRSDVARLDPERHVRTRELAAVAPDDGA